MRNILATAAILAVLSAPAHAYDACGGPPEPPDLPHNPAAATDAQMGEAREADEGFRLDIEGYLVCQQLAEMDVAAEADRGERTRASAEALQRRFREQAADARGRQSGWRDDYERWMAAWARAHGKRLPGDDGE